ncbi:hypothetical protein BCR42DRAFT_69908 [Absidia repens]|uniref:Uncharacterized protein n=1 Tax=Absidia repens TaxID=90262 RepID=A0A1X2ICC8_9FUNG|nr:hypothetical protein BCR42DRAFT_69908 [Absidia repens]
MKKLRVPEPDGVSLKMCLLIPKFIFDLLSFTVALHKSHLANWILSWCLHIHLCSCDTASDRSCRPRTATNALLQHEYLQLYYLAYYFLSWFLGQYGGLASISYQLSFYI